MSLLIWQSGVSLKAILNDCDDQKEEIMLATVWGELVFLETQIEKLSAVIASESIKPVDDRIVSASHAPSMCDRKISMKAAVRGGDQPGMW